MSFSQPSLGEFLTIKVFYKSVIYLFTTTNILWFPIGIVVQWIRRSIKNPYLHEKRKRRWTNIANKLYSFVSEKKGCGGTTRIPRVADSVHSDRYQNRARNAPHYNWPSRGIITPDFLSPCLRFKLPRVIAAGRLRVLGNGNWLARNTVVWQSSRPEFSENRSRRTRNADLVGIGRDTFSTPPTIPLFSISY